VIRLLRTGSASDSPPWLARRSDGDDLRLDGQRSLHHLHGEYLLFASQNRPDAHPKHSRHLLFMVPLRCPGINQRQRPLYDGSFANIFFDGVRVPASARLGPANDRRRLLTIRWVPTRCGWAAGRSCSSLSGCSSCCGEELRRRDAARVPTRWWRDAVCSAIGL